MKILSLIEPNKPLILVPRIFPNEDDVLVVKLRNEMKDTEQDMLHSWGFINNYFFISLEDSDFLINDTKYEITILRGGSGRKRVSGGTVIYKGKLYVTANNDIQDFKLATITNKKVKF